MTFLRSGFSVLAKAVIPEVRDFGIIGGGAAGMAAAIHARYDGHSVTVFERRKEMGGSYSNTPLIHNLPGFPVGVSGETLSHATIQQFEKLGGQFLPRCDIQKISRVGEKFFLLHDQHGGQHAVSKVILATGVDYRKLEVSGSEEFENRGISYEVDDGIIEEVSQTECPIAIYGAGNSAGQAAVFYQSLGARVRIIYKGSALSAHMSKYLIDRITRLGIETLPHHLITKVEGGDHLSHIHLKDLTTGEEKKMNAKYLFAMIGGIPHPLPKLDFDTLALDLRGYISVQGYDKGHTSFGTSVPGIYAAGDITSVGAGRILLAQAQGVAAFVEASRALSEEKR